MNRSLRCGSASGHTDDQAEKARGIDDPDQRVLAMLGARGSVELTEVRGSGYCVVGGNRSEHRCLSCARRHRRRRTLAVRMPDAKAR